MLGRLSKIVGEKGLFTEPEQMAPYLTDWRQQQSGMALAVVSPASTAEVSAVVGLCAEEGQPVFPLGGNTGLCFGAVPKSDRVDKPGIVLSLRRMSRIRAIDMASGIATVDAGVVLGNFHSHVADIDKQFPLHLGSEGSAQIGGLISTNAGGTGVVRYGPMRDLVAGLEVVLANGRVFNDLGGLRKDNTGYMLRHLFIGAEGTLGVITGAALRLFPRIRTSAHAWVSVADPAAAVELFTVMHNHIGSYIQAFELVSQFQFELVRRHIEGVRFPFGALPAWSVLVELGSEDSTVALNSMLEEFLSARLEDSTIIDAVVSQSDQQAAEFWRARHSVSEANKEEGIGIVHDISVRTSDVPSFIAVADRVSAKLYPQAETAVISHLGDGNVHYILVFQRSFWNGLASPEVFALNVEQVIHDIAAEFGGTFSAEHGIGRKLTSELKRLVDPVRYQLMWKVKQMFDPQGLMNPGALFATTARDVRTMNAEDDAKCSALSSGGGVDRREVTHHE